MTIQDLQWPTGWKRTPPRQRKSDARFDFRDPNTGRWVPITDERAEAMLRAELRQLGARRVHISMDRYGGDPGTAVYFRLNDEPLVLARDHYDTTAANMRSIALVVDGMRKITRHGGSAIRDKAFVGFVALPPRRSCWEVLGVQRGASREEIDRAYRTKALRLHPDHGGSDAAMAELNAARDEALKALETLERSSS
jgi:DnaJ domain